MTQNRPRRKMLKLAGLAAGATTGLAILPFVGYTLIHKKTTESGEIVEIDIAPLPAGQLLTVDWQGKPVWILRRTPEMLATLQETARLVDPLSDHSKQPAYAKNPHRSIKPEVFVAYGICPHLGCAPVGRFRKGADEGMPADWAGGFLCPCHTSTFDFAGRAHSGREAKSNLGVPPYRFLDDRRIRIGDDPPFL
jgi:ubiquinol-cytochrome c reductase iron-sulfur subunit